MTIPGNGVGTVVNTILASPTDQFDLNFTWVDMTNLTPTPGIGWTYNGTNFITPPQPPVLPLNQQYDNFQFGQYIIQQFANYNKARGLTTSQNLQLASIFAAAFELAEVGDIADLLVVMQGIIVDGTIVTQTLITEFVSLLNQYLTGG